MNFFVVAVLVSCGSFEPISALPDIAGIISGLSQKTKDILDDFAVPILNAPVDFIREHIRKLVSFFKGQEGEIKVPNTPFKIHFTAERCHLLGIGKRFLLVDFQKCKAEASEEKIGFTLTCERSSQRDAIDCATQQVFNLLKAVTVAVQKAKSQNPSKIWMHIAD